MSAPCWKCKGSGVIDNNGDEWDYEEWPCPTCVDSPGRLMWRLAGHPQELWERGDAIMRSGWERSARAVSKAVLDWDAERRRKVVKDI